MLRERGAILLVKHGIPEVLGDLATCNIYQILERAFGSWVLDLYIKAIRGENNGLKQLHRLQN